MISDMKGDIIAQMMSLRLTATLLNLYHLPVMLNENWPLYIFWGKVILLLLRTCEEWYCPVHIVRSYRWPAPAVLRGTTIQVAVCLWGSIIFFKTDIVFTLTMTVVAAHNGVKVLHEPHFPAAPLHWWEIVSTGYVGLEGFQVLPIPIGHYKGLVVAQYFSLCVYCCVRHKLGHGHTVTTFSHIGHFTSKVADGVMKGCYVDTLKSVCCVVYTQYIARHTHNTSVCLQYLHIYKLVHIYQYLLHSRATDWTSFDSIKIKQWYISYYNISFVFKIAPFVHNYRHSFTHGVQYTVAIKDT